MFEATKSPIAEEGLKRIQALYAVEAATNGQPPGQRRETREAQSKPQLDALHAWMLAQRRRLSGKSALGKALQYALNRWDALARYLEDGRLSIDNNLAERLLRGVACPANRRSARPCNTRSADGTRWRATRSARCGCRT